MAVAPPDTLFDEILDFLASTPTPGQIVAFKPSQALEQRFVLLVERRKEEHLTAAEHQELDEFLRMNHFMTMLKARARQKLAS